MTRTKDEFVKAIRAMADLYERQPELPVPDFTIACAEIHDKQKYVDALRKLADGGMVTKKADPRLGGFEKHYAIREFGAKVKLEISIPKKLICERRMVTVEDWVCPDSLLEEAAG